MQTVSVPGSRWRNVPTMQEASDLANQGIVVIAGLANPMPGHSGHVVVILPGPWKLSGGFELRNGRTMPSNRQLYPPMMSTSASHYPGAISNGDKTVADARTAKDFNMITYWTPQVP